MSSYAELALTSTLLCLYLETSWVLLINAVYLTIPWLVWVAIVIVLLIRFVARVPPTSESNVKKVLGLDPLSFVEKKEAPLFVEKKEALLFVENETQKVDETEAENDQQYCMRVVAHRGAGFDFPENSMSAFRNSHEKGCDAIEFDLALTKDNIPILFHDVTIDRLTGFNGTIRNMTWEELKEYDISTNHPLKVKLDPQGEKIALFEEALEETLRNGQHMFIDIKATGNEVVKVILDAFKKHPELYERAVISSFNPVTIYTIRRKDPRIVAGLAWRPQFFSTSNYNGINGPYEPRYDDFFKNIIFMMVDLIHDWALKRLTYYILGLSFILLHKDVISPEEIRQWNKRGVRVLAWTVNLPTEKMHFAKNLKITYLTDTLLS